MTTSACLNGYLEKLGTQVGRRLIDVDHDLLNAGWHRIATKLHANGDISLDETYALSSFDSNRWAESATLSAAARFPSDVAETLRRHVTAAGPQQSVAADDLLNRYSDAFSRAQRHDRTLLARIWRSWLCRSSVSARELDGLIRSVGVSFRDGVS